MTMTLQFLIIQNIYVNSCIVLEQLIGQLLLVVDLAHSAQAGPEFVLLTYQTRRNVSAVCTCQPIYNWGYLLNFI